MKQQQALAEIVPSRHTAALHRIVRRAASSRRALSLIDQAVVSVTSMGTSIIIGRACAKDQLGLYASGLSLLLLLTAIQAALVIVPYTISNPLIRRHEHPLYKGNTILQQVCLVLIGMSVFFIFGLSSHDDHLGRIFLTLAAVAGLICFRDFVRRISYAELHFRLALGIDCVLAVLQLSTIGVMARSHTLSASRALLVIGSAAACGGLLWLIVSWRSIVFSARQAVLGFQVNFALGKWLVASSVLWSICIDQYPWLLTTLRASGEAAIWASCYGVMAFLNPIVLALNNDAAPRSSHDYAARGLAGLSRGVFRSAAIAALITLPVLLALLLFGPRLVELMYGAKYAGHGGIVSVLALGLWFSAISLPFPYGMLTLNRPRVDFAINVACICSFLGPGVWLIRSHGVFGAACSYLMVQTVALVCRVVGYCQVANGAAKAQAAELLRESTA